MNDKTIFIGELEMNKRTACTAVSTLNKIGLLSEQAVAILTIILFGSLGLISIFVTAILPNYTEGIEYSTLTAPAVLLGCLLVIVAYTLAYRFSSITHVDSTIVSLTVALVLFFGSITWAILCNTFPSWDSSDLILAAKELGNGRTGYWAHGWYMERYPYQAPYVMLIRILWRLFGDDMLYLSLELVNAVCAGATGYLVVKLSSRLFSPRVAFGTGFAAVAFLPLYFYSTFAYGNVPSLPFAVGAMVSLHSGIRTKKMRHFVASGLAIAIAVMLKSTMQVVMIALVLVLLLEAVKSRKALFVAAVPLIIAINVCSMTLFNTVVSKHYDVVLDNGLSKISWIAMGLTEDSYPEVSNNPGGYNCFVWNWQLEDYDVEVAKADSIAQIKKSLNRFLSNPAFAVEFFAKKISSMWFEPTFNSLVNGNWSVSAIPGQSAMSERPMTDLLQSIYYGSLNQCINVVCDVMQTLLLFAPAVTLWSRRAKLKQCQVLPALACLGFFLIYVVWEAKSQYTLPAFILFLVYAGPALNVMADAILGILNLPSKEVESI